MFAEAYELQAGLFKALMHPARLAILDILRHGEECVCHMEAVLGYRQAYISQQLMMLRKAGLVEDRRDGWNIYYRVTRPDIYHVIDAMNEVVGQKPVLAVRSTHLREERCLCPKCNLAAEAVGN
jgi:ArsR family transcriptional regulator